MYVYVHSLICTLTHMCTLLICAVRVTSLSVIIFWVQHILFNILNLQFVEHKKLKLQFFSTWRNGKLAVCSGWKTWTSFFEHFINIFHVRLIRHCHRQLVCDKRKQLNVHKCSSEILKCWTYAKNPEELCCWLPRAEHPS